MEAKSTRWVARPVAWCSPDAAFLKALHGLLADAGVGLPRLNPRAHTGPDAGDGFFPGGFPNARIQQVIGFVEAHLDAALTLDLLAEEARLSKYHFLRLFREETGQTPWTYVIDARVRKAKALLDEGASPAEAAAEAGFCDQSHLTRAFRKVEGVTPAAYRRRRHKRAPAPDRNIVQEKAR